jgi:8-oxo-dGTP pyrophosphatase MutT (NUDIX family)
LKGGKLILRDLHLPGKTRGSGKQYLYLAYDMESIPSSVSAGGVSYTSDKPRKILAIKWKPKHYGLIKGHVDSKEEREVAVIREFSEETGINQSDLEIRRYLGSYVRYGVERESWRFEKKQVHFYEVQIRSNKDMGNGDHEVEWIPVSDLDKLIGRPSDQRFLNQHLI